MLQISGDLLVKNSMSLQQTASRNVKRLSQQVHSMTRSFQLRLRQEKVLQYSIKMRDHVLEQLLRAFQNLNAVQEKKAAASTSTAAPHRVRLRRSSKMPMQPSAVGMALYTVSSGRAK